MQISELKLAKDLIRKPSITPRDAGAIAAKVMRNKEHNKYVNFLDVDDWTYI